MKRDGSGDLPPKLVKMIKDMTREQRLDVADIYSRWSFELLHFRHHFFQLSMQSDQAGTQGVRGIGRMKPAGRRKKPTLEERFLDFAEEVKRMTEEERLSLAGRLSRFSYELISFRCERVGEPRYPNRAFYGRQQGGKEAK